MVPVIVGGHHILSASSQQTQEREKLGKSLTLSIFPFFFEASFFFLAFRSELCCNAPVATVSPRARAVHGLERGAFILLFGGTAGRRGPRLGSRALARSIARSGRLR
jgi:hypothetical protein